MRQANFPEERGQVPIAIGAHDSRSCVFGLCAYATRSSRREEALISLNDLQIRTKLGTNWAGSDFVIRIFLSFVICHSSFRESESPHLGCYRLLNSPSPIRSQ